MAAFGNFCKSAKCFGLNKIVNRSLVNVRLFSVSSRRDGETVGFIGLGNMGASMARNLIKNDYSVIVYDVVEKSVKDLQSSGAKVGAHPADITGQVKTLITMLPSSPQVREVYTGPNGVFSTLQKGTLLIDSSTIDPAVAQEMAGIAADAGAVYMDAPVSGGVVAARDALLTFMVGGPDSHFEQANTILSKIGKNVVHCGASGTGQAAKICNNMLLGISMIGTAETMNLGIKLGLDPKMLATILNMSTGRCWSSELYNPVPGVKEGIPSSNKYQGGFGVTLMAKDLGLAQNAATMNKCPTPMGSLAHQLYRVLSNTEWAGKDFTAVYQFLLEEEERQK